MCICALICACGTNDIYIGSDLPRIDGGESGVETDAARPRDGYAEAAEDAAMADAAAGCALGTADCDDDPSNGCETDLSADDANCGGCGNACPTGFSIESNGATCMDGVCIHACHLLHGDCDGNLLNGCETTLWGNDANCGACGVACSCSLSGTCM